MWEGECRGKGSACILSVGKGIKWKLDPVEGSRAITWMREGKGSIGFPLLHKSSLLSSPYNLSSMYTTVCILFFKIITLPEQNSLSFQIIYIYRCEWVWPEFKYLYVWRVWEHQRVLHLPLPAGLFCEEGNHRMHRYIVVQSNVSFNLIQIIFLKLVFVIMDCVLFIFRLYRHSSINLLESSSSTHSTISSNSWLCVVSDHIKVTLNSRAILLFT